MLTDQMHEQLRNNWEEFKDSFQSKITFRIRSPSGNAVLYPIALDDDGMIFFIMDRKRSDPETGWYDAVLLNDLMFTLTPWIVEEIRPVRAEALLRKLRGEYET